MQNKNRLRLALAIVGASTMVTSRPLYDIEDFKYSPNDSTSEEFGAPFRGRENHKRKKKGRR